MPMADRYADEFPGDSVVQTDGETQFVGIDARTEPDKLQPGFAQVLQNMRLDNLSPTVRKGTAKQTNAINPGTLPLFIPFVVGASSSIVGGSLSNGIYASCVFSDPNNNNKNYIFLATTGKCFWIDNQQNTGSITYPANEVIESVDPSTDLFQYGGSVYLLRGDVGTSFTVTSLTSTGTTATATVTNAAPLFTGAYVNIQGAMPTAYNGQYQITLSGSSFTYALANSTTSPASGTITCNRIKIPMIWSGNFSSSFALTSTGTISQNFSYMPSSNWGLLQQNRVILEYNRNAVIMSQILGPQAYDTINGLFTFAAGTADYLIGASPYQDTQTIVFLRQSAYLINGLSGDVASMTDQLLTDTVGCVSRRTIALCGQNVLFLSDRGVFMFQPGFELTLRGNSLPLSAPIDPYIKQINFAAVNVAWAAYFLNRYYLAVPINGSTRNNAVFVYNFINQQWESIDSFPTNFYVDMMQVTLNSSGTPTLYMIDKQGGIYAAEQNETDDYAIAYAQANQYPIAGVLRTRRYLFGSTELKKFNRAILNISQDANSSMTATAFSFSPENTRTLFTVATAGASSTVTRPAIINQRAYGLELQLANASGRFVLNRLSIGAYVKDKKSTPTT